MRGIVLTRSEVERDKVLYALSNALGICYSSLSNFKILWASWIAEGMPMGAQT